MHEIQAKDIEKTNQLNEILNELVSIDLMDKDEFQDRITLLRDNIIDFYSKFDRHSYSEVSRFFLNMDPGDIEYFLENLDYFREEIQDSNIKRELDRVKDHVKLEELRIDYIRKNQIGISEDFLKSVKKTEDNFTERTNELSNKLSESENALKEHDKSIRRHKKSIEGFNSQLISIIGIFSAIVIAFFGGSELFSSTLESISAVSKYRLVFIIILISLVMFDTIFMLLNFISKLIDKEIVSKKCLGYKVDKNKCSNCKHNKGFWNYFMCIAKRYPLVFWVNLLLLILLLIVSITYYIDTYNAFSKYFDFAKYFLKR
ncbi:hypothetical protein [Clostridium perfringens]|uniref:hypothetical protein n=1 Tax=Clostridium perfringens TaxID=1502 RepID=UPI0023F8CD2E|nr:hypothetical protein [Clostridium perfringens]ELC8384900.1 hypothetical protein [Clostridium perfringens]ELC8406246.1 hypothetical protein [Clostridium perfringens]WEV20092.1 hypothetical protein PL323_05525 [Clostridium perfringens D]